MPSAEITKRAIADTMKKLMAQRPLGKITVGDIATECGVTRNSFYYHFKDKYDLVNWIFYTEITEEMNHLDLENTASWIMLEHICEFFYADKVFYQNALSVTGQNSFTEYFSDLMQKLVAIRAADLYVEDEDREFLVSRFSHAFVSSISRWLTEVTPMPPDRFLRLIKKFLTGIAIRIVESDSEYKP